MLKILAWWDGNLKDRNDKSGMNASSVAVTPLHHSLDCWMKDLHSGKYHDPPLVPEKILQEIPLISDEKNWITKILPIHAP